MTSQGNEYQLSEAPPQPVPILAYCQSLGTLCQATDASRMHWYHVRRVLLFKRRKGSRHEYLTMELLHRDGTKLYLCLEWGPGDSRDCEGKHAGSPLRPSAHSFLPDPARSRPFQSESSLPLESGTAHVSQKRGVRKKASFVSSYLSVSSSFPQTSNKSTPPSSPSSSGNSISNSIPSKRYADDRVSTLPSPGARNKDDELLIEVTFVTPDASTHASPSPHSRTGPYLHEVAVLASVVHRLNPAYTLTTHNCFFFANMLLKCLQELYVVASVDTITESAPRFCGLSKETPPGSFSGMTVCDPAKLVTAQIKEAFPGTLARFEAPVSFHSVSAKIR